MVDLIRENESSSHVRIHGIPESGMEVDHNLQCRL